MFLRRKSKHARGVGYSYWHLCETVRTARGPRQRIVASLGKLDQAQVSSLKAGWDNLPAGRETVAWAQVAALLTIARFCAQPSELGVADETTALDELLGVDPALVNDARLYRALDQLGRHLGQYPAAAAIIRAEVLRDEQGQAGGLQITSALALLAKMVPPPGIEPGYDV